MAFSIDTITALNQSYGLILLLPLSVVEGPIVSVIAGWLVRLGLLPFGWAFGVLLLGDLIGDVVYYAIGRSGAGMIPDRWRSRLGLDAASTEQLVRHFEGNGGRTLILAKLTHSLGFAALIAAGVARMPLPAFLWFNLLGTLPKSLLFLMLGYGLGHASAMLDTWIWRISLVLLVLGVGGFLWFLKHRVQRT